MLDLKPGMEALGDGAGNGSWSATAPVGPTAGDWAKVAYTTVLFLLGAPLNMAAAQELWGPRGAKGGGLNLFQRSLNAADLAIVFVFAVSEICWTLTYRWAGGRLLCKAIAAGRVFAFQLSSNSVAGIAVYRAVSLGRPSTDVRRLRLPLGLVWGLAAVLSLPQLFVWETFTPSPAHPHWQQCVTVFDIHLHNGSAEGGEEMAWRETLYLAQHLVTIFWLPLLVVLVSYAAIALRVHSRWRGYTSMQKSEAGGSVRWRSSTGATQMTLMTPPPPQKGMGGQTTGEGSQGEVAQLSEAGRAESVAGPAEQLVRYSLLQNRATAICLRLCGAFVLLWTPYNVLQALKMADKDWYVRESLNWDHLNCLLVLNAVINPLLYGSFNL